MSVLTRAQAQARLFGRSVLIDTNVVVYLTENVATYGPLADFVFRSLEEGRFTAVLSAVTIAEVMMGPLRSGRPDLARRVERYLLAFPNTTCQAVDSRVLAALGADSRVRWERLRAVDALILASGLAAGADLVLSNDQRWRGALGTDLLVTFDQEGDGLRAPGQAGRLFRRMPATRSEGWRPPVPIACRPLLG